MQNLGWLSFFWCARVSLPNCISGDGTLLQQPDKRLRSNLYPAFHSRREVNISHCFIAITCLVTPLGKKASNPPFSRMSVIPILVAIALKS